MHPFQYHVFACEQRKPEGVPSCTARGSSSLVDALRREVSARNLVDRVAVTPCGSLGLCESGPNLVVYPEGVWYSRVSSGDVVEIVTEHFQNGRPVERLMRKDGAQLKAEISEGRGRMLAALASRDAAGVVPDELLESIRGFMSSRVLLTAIELDVFTALARVPGPATAAIVTRALGTDRRATETLLNALAALGVVAKKDGAYSNGPVAARFLVAGTPDDARISLRHNASLWASWSALTDVVRSGKCAVREEMCDRPDSWTTPFIAAMHRNAALRAPAVVKAVGAQGVRRVLDIGGGSGAYSIAFAKAHPGLEAEVFDLASVVGIAERHIAEAGLDGRIHTRVGDLRHDSFGSGYDLALLSAICHMLGPEENSDLFRRVFGALSPGGRIVVQDHLMSDDKTSPRSGALFAVNMLVGTPHGGTYTSAEYGRWLREAGFSLIETVPLQSPSGLVIGSRP